MVDLDLTQLPFALLDAVSLEQLRGAADLSYFEKGEVILDAGQAGNWVYLIHKGAVTELDVLAPSARSRIGLYTAGDLFGAISVLNGKSRYRFVADQQTLCYLVPGELFQRLCNHNNAFADYFRQRLTEKSQLLVEQREGGVTLAGFMLARIRDCMRPPLIMDADISIHDAVSALKTHRADSLLIRRGNEFGVVTKTDLLNALVLGGHCNADPARVIAHYDLVTARSDEFLFSALVSMTRHEVARVVVMDRGRPAGVVELTDVLSYFSSRSYVVGLEIEKADDLDTLALASARLPELVRALMAQGVKLRFAMDLLAALNGRIISKAWHFTVPEPHRQTGCLIVMGSEGRGEQILKTDQDNGLILDDGAIWPDQAGTMNRFTDTLLRLGYPPCPGNVMVSNPDWTGSQTRWHARIQRWAADSGGDTLLNLSIMADAHPIVGNAGLLDNMRDTLLDRCSTDQVLMSHFARGVLRFSTPLTLFGTLKKPEHGIDIKKGGIFPIVHGVRALAMSQSIRETSTFDRLEQLSGRGITDRHFAEDLGEALSLFSELRLKRQLAALDAGDTYPDGNHIVVQELSSLERDMLRDALHVVNEFKQRLSRRFHLEY
ncbi:DUF294 nucleotidyltransferase-like domain-containing protein [Alcanivorax sp. JB21]|uniref:putative nucleotidyltransferase substrate binding domain-containing protein n=1 Tax=Alcanivorax limicola TaxID=2874102 RepID=UPI001CBD706A|nr:putative nucleotidyltransferase substrate binding domain-containing protein [Alcanivorax limicola]MBZ2190192.1 DUF294 nucleotidyltransferase-like domain-containing protein [Alcanivorax limicola]